MDKKMASGPVSTVRARDSSPYRRDNPRPPPSPVPAPVPAPVQIQIPPLTPPQAPIPAPVPAGATSISTASLTITVTDNATALPVRNAAVTVDTVRIKTDKAGKAVFANISMGDHKYTVSKRGYKRVIGIVRIAGDATVQVKLVSK